MIDLETIAERQEKLRSGVLSCVEIVQNCLQQLDVAQQCNAYVQVFRSEALERARFCDDRATSNPQAMGKLWGAVISIKDVISYQNHPLTAASKILSGYRPLYSATAVERLLAEDAIIIGITNCDEFAMGSDNRNSYYGAVRNADHPDHVPGGSSGGAAVSVQTGSCHVALGSDTGGSVRQPASFCNLVGFKPSYGCVSRHGLIAYASSFDQIGLIAKRIEDISKVFEVIMGPDHWDSTMLPQKKMGLQSTPEAPKAAYIQEALDHPALQPAIRQAFHKKLDKLKDTGWSIKAVSLKEFDYVIPTYYVLTSAEASSNLSRYDGIRYGHRSAKTSSLQEMYTSTRSEGFGDEVKRRILLGTFVLSVGYYDAYFSKAQKVRRLLRDQFDDWFDQYHAILLPTTPSTPWKQNESLSPVAMYLADIYSVLPNLIGAPAISLPMGKDEEDLPFGLQLICQVAQDDQVLSLGHFCG